MSSQLAAGSSLGGGGGAVAAFKIGLAATPVCFSTGAVASLGVEVGNSGRPFALPKIAAVFSRFVGAGTAAGSLASVSFAPELLAGEITGSGFAGFSVFVLPADFAASASLNGPGLICAILSFSTST